MSYNKRIDGRKFNELRPIEAKVGVIPRADGSAFFKIGNTWAYATVYGPRNLYPKALQNPARGILRCTYNMMPFSGAGERVRPGPSRRSKEISLVTENALLPVLNLEDFPNSVVDVYIDLPQTDAGSRCAGITAAAMALADAGIPMKDMPVAVAVGKVDNQFLVDLNYEEEAYEGEVVDMPIAIIPRTREITLLQMDGQLKPDDFEKLLDIAIEPLLKINEIQKRALKEKFKGLSEDEVKNNDI
ncbi:MAG: exosome complex exonuclease Rrp41 [Candidatus Woesearchaeota archaeon]